MKSVVLFLLCLVGQSAFAGTAKLAKVVLYQPGEVVSARIPDVKLLSAYIKSLRPLCEQSFTSNEQESVDVVVVVKPNGQARVWFISSKETMPDRSQLKTEIENVRPPIVQSGPVVFALAYNLNGFERVIDAGTSQPPIPAEWREKSKTAKEPLLIPDGFISYIWPD